MSNLSKESGKPCDGFNFVSASDAFRHMKYEIIEDYGKFQYNHRLYVWDDGNRVLAKCKNCGGYILIQSSEYHSFTDAPDGYYTDFFPVSSPEEADELNRKFDGFQIEREFKQRYLMETDGVLRWSK